MCVCVCLFSNLLSLLLHKVRSYSFLKIFFSHQVLVFFVPTTSIMHLLRWTIFHFPFPNSILLFGRLLKSMTSVLSAHLQTYRPASTHRHTRTHAQTPSPLLFSLFFAFLHLSFLTPNHPHRPTSSRIPIERCQRQRQHRLSHRFIID